MSTPQHVAMSGHYRLVLLVVMSLTLESSVLLNQTLTLSSSCRDTSELTSHTATHLLAGLVSRSDELAGVGTHPHSSIAEGSNSAH